jgi:hypothetical protein
VCVSLNKKPQAAQIFKTLLRDTKGKHEFKKEQLEKAIMEAREAIDKRTIKNWWDYLWKFCYFSQIHPGIYKLDLKKVLELELELELVDPHQLHLIQTEHTHTFSEEST